ncbi:phytanoyl-CoA dioxygenase family protein [Microbulbifer guangxiensis]|uniref:phytanoyl-CoA dioxygenase family protein n=1 Tax=Microbulbifer guangxiensis TaxID=2904249 RepID=UPI001F41C38E|nr:phytanoyl-CoA dioxygenase family protein [Microbulbifer guangxiensis]
MVKNLKKDEKLWGDDPFSLQEGLRNISDAREHSIAKNFYRDGFVHLSDVLDSGVCDAAVNSYRNWCDSHRKDMYGIRGDTRNPRVVNLHSDSDEVKRLFTSSQFLLNVLDLLFGYRASVYTSLTFQYGTEQPFHRDTPVFRTAPEEFYFGVWFALEDANKENGCLRVLKGGHKGGRVDQYSFAEELVSDVNQIQPGGKGLWVPYQNAVVEKCWEEGGVSEEYLEAKKGDVVIWHPQLPHGGSPIRDASKTRMSVVYHVVPERVPVYQADVFFNRSKSNASLESDKSYYEFEGREFMRTVPPRFGSN